MKQQGLPVDKKMEAAFRDLVRHGVCFGDGNLEKQQEAFGRICQQIQQTVTQLGQPDLSRYNGCDRCGERAGRFARLATA
jgi:hypothetical protein